ncbi:MAG: hypothetical protein M1816_007102 [Peltula sp. TS41687]|nr:MAG: hypothetical protein M1816_007102 [Peltula sp. TS41687]
MVDCTATGGRRGVPGKGGSRNCSGKRTRWRGKLHGGGTAKPPDMCKPTELRSQSVHELGLALYPLQNHDISSLDSHHAQRRDHESTHVGVRAGNGLEDGPAQSAVIQYTFGFHDELSSWTLNDIDQPALTSSSVELLYPVLSIDRSTGCRTSDSAPDSDMASPSDDHFDDAGSCTSESAYEVLGDSTVLTSDDEDRDDTSDSLVSVGMNTPADVSSIAGTDDGEDDVSTGSQMGLDESTTEAAQGTGEPEDVSRSDMTIRHKPVDNELFFNEFPLGADNMFGQCLLRTFSMQHSLRIQKNLSYDQTLPAEVTALGHQEMAKRELYVGGPFQVLYVGNPSAKQQIIAKLVSALAVGSPPTHRDSSQASVASSSSYLDAGLESIESLGIKLTVDECTSATNTRDTGSYVKPRVLSVLVNDVFWCHSRQSDEGFVYEGRNSWMLPHLTVFFVSDEDDRSARDTRENALNFMRRHGVPTLMISESALYERPPEEFSDMTKKDSAVLERPWPVKDRLYSSSLHACLVMRGKQNYWMWKLPIDLNSFLRVNNRQLNRNLAFMTKDEAERRRKSSDLSERKCLENVAMSSRRTPKWADGTERRPGDAEQDRPALALLALLIFFVVTITGCTISYYKFGTSGLAEDSGYQGPVGALVDFSKVAPLTGMRPTSPAMAVTSGTSGSKTEKRLPTSEANSKSLAVLSSKDLASILTEESIMVLNQSDNFKTQMVGDCHIILRLPRKLSALRKTPALAVKVLRQGQVVDAEVSKLFDGVYALRFQREDAWGGMDVTVSTTTKPLLSQTFQVDCGKPWLKIREWRKAALGIANQLQHNLKRAQGGLGKSLAQAHTGIQTVVGQTIQRQTHVLGGLRALGGQFQLCSVQGLSQKAQQLTDSMEAQRRALLQGLSDHANAVSGTVSADLGRARENLNRVWKQVDEFRTVASKTLTVARARIQAGRVWARITRRPPTVQPSLEVPVEQSGSASSSSSDRESGLGRGWFQRGRRF